MDKMPNPIPPTTSRLRQLGFDDLFVLHHLYNGRTLVEIAALLGLTQPAISQRLRKMERAFETPLVRRAGRGLGSTADGSAICAQASEALVVMHGLTAVSGQVTLTVGVASQLDLSLWAVLSVISQSCRNATVELVSCAPEDLRRRMSRGTIDAAIDWRSPHTGEWIEQRTLLTSEVVLIGQGGRRTPQLTPDADHILFDCDPEDGLASHLRDGAIGTTRFKAVRSVGTFGGVVAAVLNGLGFGLVPRHFVRGAITNGSIAAVAANLSARPFTLDMQFPTGHRHARHILELATRLASALTTS